MAYQSVTAQEGRGVAWLVPPCSRNPHDEAVVVRRAQLGTKPSHPLKEDNERSQKYRREAARPSFLLAVLVRCAQGRTVWLFARGQSGGGTEGHAGGPILESLIDTRSKVHDNV